MRERTLPYLLVTPVMLVVICLTIYPFFYAIFLSFHEKIPGNPPIFVGLANYSYILHHPDFRQAILNTLFYVFFAIGIKTIYGMAIALVLNQDFKQRNLVRALVFLPWAVPKVVQVLTWRWMYSSRGGVINWVLTGLGLSSVNWLGDPNIARWAVVLVNVWGGVPFFGIMFLAGLQSLPREMYEAAEIDGASVFRRFVHLTLPNLANVIYMTIFLSAIWTFNDFETVWLLTRGGPLNKTHIFTTLAYQTAIVEMNLGKGAAISILSLPFLIVFVMMLVRRMLEEEA